MIPRLKNRAEMPEKHQRVAQLLRRGKEGALLGVDIIRLAELTDHRQLSEVIESLIKDYGYPIGTNRKKTEYSKPGYYLLDSPDELRGTIFTLNSQVQSMLDRIKALQRNYYLPEDENKEE